jgi:two-component system chemotaxis response regulator CheB
MPYRVLIVDDSPFYRLRLAQVVSASDQLQLVGIASDGREAIRLIGERHPDLIILDLEMPGLDGMSVLRWTMRYAPVPVIICSGRGTSETVFQALEIGAVDFVAKPELRHAVRSEQFATNLRQRMEAAAQARLPSAKVGRDSQAIVAAAQLARTHLADTRIVGIVGSAGGPTAVSRIISALPASFRTPVIIALHMPAGFTRSFAERLKRIGRVEAGEAKDGEKIVASRIYVAPGGWQTTVALDKEGDLILRVKHARTEDKFAPSADLLLQSLAEACGEKALGVVVTGMGQDGVKGARAIRARGGTVIVESKESALIWGMPRAVAEAGLASAELDLLSIVTTLSLLCK